MQDLVNTGGIPEYVLNKDRNYLISLVDDIISKDIIAFHNIKNKALIKDYFLLLTERAGKQISLNKIANILKISSDTAGRYLTFFEETYLIHLVSHYGKTNQKILSPKKIYLADLGIKNVFTGFKDKGSLFENYVYLQIKHLFPFYVLEKGIEIDFITSRQELIEVKYHSNLNQKQQKLFDQFKARKKVIIKNNEELEKWIK